MTDAPSETESCLFCRIIAGDVPGEVVARNEGAIAFRDISPVAPTHVLVVPRVHVPDLSALAGVPAALAAVAALVGEVAEREGAEAYRTVFNTGSGAGQTVFHVHAHVLAGRPFGWPPG